MVTSSGPRRELLNSKILQSNFKLLVGHQPGQAALVPQHYRLSSSHGSLLKDIDLQIER